VNIFVVNPFFLNYVRNVRLDDKDYYQEIVVTICP